MGLFQSRLNSQQRFGVPSPQQNISKPNRYQNQSNEADAVRIARNLRNRKQATCND